VENFFFFSLEQLPYLIIVLMIAFTVHEFAHAYAAYRFGDDTAKKQGRLTLSPLSHLDPFGTILIFIAGFGWAKPVPVNRFKLSRPKLGGIIVSLAGPFSNLLLVMSESLFNIGYQFFNTLIYLNAVLFIFNLLPFPPLDGYRVIEDLVPHGVRPTLRKYENYGVLIFLIIVLTPLDQYIIQPIFSILVPALLDFIENGAAALLLK
jgi:Zn-dependent protease